MPKRYPPEFVEEVLAWAEEHRRGVKVTAKHFSVSRSTVQHWFNRARDEGVRAAAAERRRAKLLDAGIARPGLELDGSEDDETRDRMGNRVDWANLADVVRPDVEPNVELVLAPTQIGRKVLGELTPGCRVCGLTKGQVSALDLARAMIEHAVADGGPVDVIIATWSTGLRDVETAAWLLRHGAIRSLKLITDHSFRSRKPQYIERMVELFGDEAICLTRTHAKFVVVRNERWNLVLRTSANLNRNPRIEQFDLDDNAKIAELFVGFAAEWFRRHGSGITQESQDVDAAFEALLGGGKGGEEGAADEEVREALEEWDPVSMTREDFLVRAIKATSKYSQLEYRRGHGQSARSWFEMSERLQREYQDIQDEKRRREEAARILPDAAELARAIVDRLPELAPLAPAACKRAALAIAEMLGEDVELQRRIAVLRAEIGQQ